MLINNIIETINNKKLKIKNNFLINKIKKDNRKIVLSIGRLEKQKNFKFLLKSFFFFKRKKNKFNNSGKWKVTKLFEFIYFAKIN